MYIYMKRERERERETEGEGEIRKIERERERKIGLFHFRSVLLTWHLLLMLSNQVGGRERDREIRDKASERERERESVCVRERDQAILLPLRLPRLATGPWKRLSVHNSIAGANPSSYNVANSCSKLQAYGAVSELTQ